MERENQVSSDIVELGVASDETKGPVGNIADFQLGRTAMGLSDE